MNGLAHAFGQLEKHLHHDGTDENGGDGCSMCEDYETLNYRLDDGPELFAGGDGQF